MSLDRSHNPLTRFGQYALLIGGGAILMVPFVWLVLGSLKTDQEISQIPRFDSLEGLVDSTLPDDPQPQNFVESLQFMGLELRPPTS